MRTSKSMNVIANSCLARTEANCSGSEKLPGKSGDLLHRSWTTAAVKPSERFAYYREAICQAFMRVTPECPSGIEFSANGQSIGLGNGALNRVQFPAHTTIRSRADVAASDRRGFYLNLRLAGESVVEQAGCTFVQSPGQVSIIDSDRPFRFAHQPSEPIKVASFWVPADNLRERLGPAFDIKPVQLSGDPHLGSLITETARTLNAKAFSMEANEAARLFEVLLELVALGLRRESHGVKESTSIAHATLLSVKRAIETKLHEPGLKAVDVAAAAGVSERYVHMLLARTGTTFSDYLMERRLDGAAADLRKVDPLNQNVGNIAFDWGFVDLSHFSRRFKQRFGMRPRDWRNQK
ncbi:helix-turn-helix domain-containing protein [Bradyrhizobium sp. NBAIM14]|uniref:helix-turn-helix domain-containing protein n=1 Tax=Bradyrhizobium sp. NBAIM14 TaxID=2793814 RepID=UPI001CD59B10|nr:helix-turn-helix domain-containing protein [Bradyrhizobium sp. NBAIM14]